MPTSLRESGWVRCAIVLALVCVGCSSDATAPTPMTGTYMLSLYDGKALPVGLRNIVLIPANGGRGWTCNESLVGATLSIESAGTAISIDTRRTTCDDGRPDVTAVVSRTGTVSASRDTSTISYPATETAPSYRAFARWSGSGILIFRSETDQFLITSAGAPPATTMLFNLTERLYVPQP